MSAGHTPGPWAATLFDDGGAYVDATDSSGQHVRIFSRCELPDPRESHANARLIAAAPDLLAACEALLACQSNDCWCDDDGDDYMSGGCAACQARAVIAKAKGGAK